MDSLSKMKIQEYISELLYEHDCVIVPDFGGFVCNYSPSRIDSVKHLFEPPAKRIIFNKGLTRNDGLLAHHVADKLKLSYSQALDTIAAEVKQFKSDIEKDKRLNLENIGLLYLDEKGNLLFQQDNKLNYLVESFGLTAFYHSPVEQTQAENEGKVIPIYHERKKARTYAAAAVIAALVTSAFYFTVVDKQTNLHLSGLDIFSKREAVEYAFSPVTYKELPKPVFEPFKVAEVSNASSYSIIAGSFSEKQHAEKLINQLSKQNIHLSILGKNPQGLYVVGYGKYTSHNDAAAERDNLKKYIKDAWIKAN